MAPGYSRSPIETRQDHVLTPSVLVVATAAVMLSLTWFSIGLRGWVRAILVKSFQTDDWMLLAAQVCYDQI